MLQLGRRQTRQENPGNEKDSACIQAVLERCPRIHGRINAGPVCLHQSLDQTCRKARHSLLGTTQENSALCSLERRRSVDANWKVSHIPMDWLASSTFSATDRAWRLRWKGSDSTGKSGLFPLISASPTMRHSLVVPHQVETRLDKCDRLQESQMVERRNNRRMKWESCLCCITTQTRIRCGLLRRP